MCLIAYRPKPGAHIPNDVIDYNLRINPDGFGIAWRDPEVGLMWEKFGPQEKDDFVGLLKGIDKTDMEYAAHWRKATHGYVNREMSHPFEYTDADDTYMLAFHNGIITIPTGNGESDTFAFVNRILAKLPYRWWLDDALKFLVEETIGWSRFLIMSEDEAIILNRNDWKTDNGIMYSTTPGPVWKSQSTSEESCGINGCQTPKWAHGYDDDYDGGYYSRSPEDPILLPDKAKMGWYHDGHPISATSVEGEIGEEYGTALCDECKTEGEYFVIDGKRYIDIDHLFIDAESKVTA